MDRLEMAARIGTLRLELARLIPHRSTMTPLDEKRFGEQGPEVGSWGEEFRILDAFASAMLGLNVLYLAGSYRETDVERRRMMELIATIPALTATLKPNERSKWFIQSVGWIQMAALNSDVYGMAIDKVISGPRADFEMRNRAIQRMSASAYRFRTG